jgi:biotin synthase
MNSSTTVSNLVDFEALADKSLRGEALSHEEAHQVLDAPSGAMDVLLGATRRVREAHYGRRCQSVRAAQCAKRHLPEDCNYCSQSKISKAASRKYKLLPEEAIVERAHDAAATGAKRFCIVNRGARARSRKTSTILSSAVRPHQRRCGDAAHGNLAPALG